MNDLTGTSVCLERHGASVEPRALRALYEALEEKSVNMPHNA